MKRVPFNQFYAITPFLFQVTLRPIVKKILQFFCHLEVRGLENLENLGGNVVFISNHTNELDGFIIPTFIPISVWRKPIFPVSRNKDFYREKGLRGKIYGGWFFKFMGAWPTYTGLRNYKLALQNHIRILNDGYSALIFPEGRIPRNSESERSAKAGGVFLAAHTNKPVVLVSLNGIKNMTFGDFFLRRRHLRVEFSRPQKVSEIIGANKPFEISDYKRGAKIAMKRIYSLQSNQSDSTYMQDKKSSHKKNRKFAFLIHPRHEQDIYIKFPWLKYVPKNMRKWILKRIPPVFVSKVTGLRSKEGELIEGYIYALPTYPKQLLEDRLFASKRIRQAVNMARDKGVGLIGLGGQTASFSKGGLEVSDIEGIGITTGRAYTIKNVTDYVKYIVHHLDLDKSQINVAVVGAAGSIGSSCVKRLDDWGIDNFILIDLEHKLKHLQNVLHKHHHNAVVTHHISAIKEADIIITATTAPEVLVKPDDLKPGAIIVNDAQPSDVSPRVHDERPDVLVVEGGVVNTPNIYCNVNMGLAHPDDTYCCLAEVLILAHHGHFNNFAVGRLDHDLIPKIEKMAEELNFSITALQNERGLIGDDQIENTKKIIHEHNNITANVEEVYPEKAM